MRYITGLIILITKIGVSQNVVPNFDFEGNSSTNHLATTKAVDNWYCPNGGTPDYRSFEDDFAVGFYLFSVKPNRREYLSVKLNQTLEDSTRYHFSCKVKVRGDNRFASGYISAFFSHHPIALSDQKVLDTVPQITVASPMFLEKTGAFFEVSDTFTVNGGEQYLTLGNFFPDKRTRTIEFTDDLQRHDWNFVYLYIDDVKVYALPDVVHDSMDVPFPRDTVHAFEPQFELYVEPYNLVNVDFVPLPLTSRNNTQRNNSEGRKEDE